MTQIILKSGNIQTILSGDWMTVAMILWFMMSWLMKGRALLVIEFEAKGAQAGVFGEAGSERFVSPEDTQFLSIS